LPGKRHWFVPDGFLPAESSGGFVSHEAACLLNAGDEDARVVLTFFFEDGEPVGPVELALAARRTRHVRLDDPAALGGVTLPRGVPYAYAVESDTDRGPALAARHVGRRLHALHLDRLRRVKVVVDRPERGPALSRRVGSRLQPRPRTQLRVVAAARLGPGLRDGPRVGLRVRGRAGN
jgi:hypothetical protein